MARQPTRSEKIRATKLERTRIGLKASGVAKYGFRTGTDGVVERIDEQIAVIHDIDRMRGEGMSYRQIAAHLNVESVPPPGRGEKWHATSVRRILEDNYYRQRPTPADLDGWKALRAAHVVKVTGVLGPKQQ